MDSKVNNCPVTVRIGDFELRFEEDDELDQESIEIAERELRETEDVRETALEAFREILRADTQLNFPIEDNSALLTFLRPCKFYPESAYLLLQKHYQFRLKNPKIYKDLTPLNDKNIFDQNILTVLPKRDQFGRRVLLIESGAKWVPSKCKLEEIFRGCALFLAAATREPKTQVSGVVVMIDQAGLSLNHVMQFTPGFARTIVSWVQECLPIRLKGVHIVNQPYIFNMLFTIFKPFLQEKLRKRIHFHGTDRKSLLKHIDSGVLPQRYGGLLDIPEVPGHVWYDHMKERTTDFELLNTLGYQT